MKPKTNLLLASAAISSLALTSGCERTTSNWDARETANLEKPVKPHVLVDAETTPLNANAGDDTADDPAIWIHPTDRSKSLILATNKKAGLLTYRLDGEEAQFLPTGMVNNVDVRYGFELAGKRIDVAAATNRTTQKLSLFGIDPETGNVRDLSSPTLPKSKVDDVYGLCLYQSRATGKLFAFLNGKNGSIEQWELFETPNGKIDGKIVRTFAVNSQPEGMVANDETASLYVGEENVGIWKFGAEPDSGDTRSFLAMSSAAENPNIVYDVEGLALYQAAPQTGYLIASIQGNNSYAIFQLGGDTPYLGSFSAIGSGSIDGIEETDGLDVTNLSLGARYPNGLFVAQDGYNFDPQEQPIPQNFKLVNWSDIAASFEPPLLVSPAYDAWLNR